MSEDKTYVTIYMKVSELRTDPVQYKPYSPVLTADEENFPLYVAIDVESKFADERTGVHQWEDLPPNAAVLTLQGLTDVMGQIALAIRNRLEN